MNGFKTYLGIAITVLGGLASQLGVEANADLPGWVDTVVMAVGALLAAYGRYDKERRSIDVKK